MAIRNTKRELICYKETGLDNEFNQASGRLNTLKKEYKEFSNIAGSRQKLERTQVNGFDKSISQKSSIMGNKVLQEEAEQKAINAAK